MSFKRRRKKAYHLLLGVTIYILIVGVGLSVFNDKLNIKGSITSRKYFENNKMDVILIKQNNDNYMYLNGSMPSHVKVEKETWKENELSVNYRAIHKNSPVRKTNVNFQINNNTSFIMRNGKTTIELSSNNSNLYNIKANLSSKIINPYSPIIVYVTFDSQVSKLNKAVWGKITISYLVNNQEKYFYFIINYLPQI